MTSLLTHDQRAKATEAAFPDWMPPMLASLTDRRFSDPNWIFERKLDGERGIAYCSGSDVVLRSRNRRELNGTYPEIVSALAACADVRCVVDGEIVAFEGRLTSFSKLQQRLGIENPEEARQSDVRVYYYVFDLLYVESFDARALPLRARKSILRRLIAFDDPLRWTAYRNEIGERYYRSACRKGWEGIIAKDATAAYNGGRSSAWLKFKCVHQQEFVVGGFTDPQGSRTGFGALLLGVYKGDRLVYVGKVGTGFDERTLDSLRHRLGSMRRKTTPFDDSADEDAHWVSPRLVAEIGFTEWTPAGKLRHPRFLGLRRDKDPHEVKRERPSS